MFDTNWVCFEEYFLGVYKNLLETVEQISQATEQNIEECFSLTGLLF